MSSSLELRLQQEVKVEYFNLGGLFYFFLWLLYALPGGRKRIGLEGVQEDRDINVLHGFAASVLLRECWLLHMEIFLSSSTV